LTPLLTSKKIERVNLDNDFFYYCLTFDESIRYASGIHNITNFFCLTENENYDPCADAFFYFISKLNQGVQVPIRRG